MVTKVVIRDNQNSPVGYISKLDNFKNETEYTFKEGVNVIVGENGCGKTTLLDLICIKCRKTHMSLACGM